MRLHLFLLSTVCFVLRASWSQKGLTGWIQQCRLNLSGHVLLPSFLRNVCSQTSLPSNSATEAPHLSHHKWYNTFPQWQWSVLLSCITLRALILLVFCTDTTPSTVSILCFSILDLCTLSSNGITLANHYLTLLPFSPIVGSEMRPGCQRRLFLQRPLPRFRWVSLWSVSSVIIAPILSPIVLVQWIQGH